MSLIIIKSFLDIALSTIERSKESFKILEEKLDSSIFNECVQSYNTWKNALSVIISSRVILLDFEKDKYFSALIPFFDSISKKDDNQVTKWYSSKGVLYVYLEVPVNAGEELFREVGLSCSTELLILNGFINDNNIHNPCVSIPKRIVNLNRDNNEVLYKKRYEFGKQYKLLDEERYKIFKGGITQELVASLELMFMNERDFVSADEEEQNEATKRIRNDMYEYLFRELKGRLDGYPSFDVCFSFIFVLLIDICHFIIINIYVNSLNLTFQFINLKLISFLAFNIRHQK